jgi:hypothetical protein
MVLGLTMVLAHTPGILDSVEMRKPKYQGLSGGKAEDYLVFWYWRLPTTLRNCLRCGRTFKSFGPQNRLCSLCSRPGDWSLKTYGFIK